MRSRSTTLALGLIFVLTACGGGDASDTTTTSTTSSVPASTTSSTTVEQQHLFVHTIAQFQTVMAGLGVACDEWQVEGDDEVTGACVAGGDTVLSFEILPGHEFFRTNPTALLDDWETLVTESREEACGQFDGGPRVVAFNWWVMAPDDDLLQRIADGTGATYVPAIACSG